MMRLRRILVADGLQKVAVLLSGLFVWPFIAWIREEGLFGAEAFSLAAWTLVGSCAVGVTAVGARRLFRASAEAVVVLFVFAAIAPVVWPPFPTVAGGAAPAVRLVRLLEAIWRWAEEAGREAAVWLPISLGVWLAFCAVRWWARVWWRVMALTVAGVTAMAVRDSYSTVYLWDQAVWVIVCGLGLLSVRHFDYLRRRRPESWTPISEYPGAVWTTLAILGVSMATLGVAAPDLRPVLKDPYTFWMERQGKTVLTGGKTIIDAPVSSADASSGYSRNSSQLGGGFRFDYSPVMTVTTSHRAYWRGETLSRYTGRGWEQTAAERNAPRYPVVLGEPLEPAVETGPLKYVEVRQSVTMLRKDERFPVLFAAATPERIEGWPEEGRTSLPLFWTPALGELRVNYRGVRQFPETYTVASRVPVLDEAVLRQAPPPEERAELLPYLQLPSTLPDRVRDLARSLTENAATPYDKVKAIETYLNTTFKYTNEPDESKGRSADFVDRFLFEIREGYCDYFSTAMAVMVRSIGLPARWVKGYAPGQLPQDPLEFLGIPRTDENGAGTYTVRNADAHSWVEVYFEGIGWIPFEPTPGFAVPVVRPAEETAPEAALPENVGQTEEPKAENGSGGLSKRIAVATAAAASAVAIALSAVWAVRRRGLLSRGAARDPNQVVAREFVRLLRHARRKGYMRLEHETARETFSRWARQNEKAADALFTFLDLFEKARYSGRRVTEAEAAKAERMTARLRSEL